MLENNIVSFLKKTMLLIAVLVVGFSVKEDAMAESRASVEKLTISIDGEKIVSSGVSTDSMPNGLDFDAETNTLTLTDFSCEGSMEITGGTINLVLVGDNTISTGEDTAEWIGIKSSNLVLQGEGTLNIFSKATKGYGILTEGFKMLSGTLNIEADNETSFYGISKYPSYQKASSDYEILGGKITITSADVSNFNVGIDAQNSNLIMKHADIEVSIGKGYGYGVVTGLKESSAKYHGGVITIDQADIRCFVQKGWSMYFFEMQNSSDSKYYVGAESDKTEAAFEEIFISNPYYCNRYECEVQYLSIHTPVIVTPEPTPEPTPTPTPGQTLEPTPTPTPSPYPGDGLPFDDVNKKDWFFINVKYVFDNHIMTGLTETAFGPYDSLSRAQFALILYRMQGSPAVTADNPFQDISGDEWYANAVLWAQANGIVTGYTNGMFGPADLITREQMAVMMYRYAGYLKQNTGASVDLTVFSDGTMVSEFATEPMQWVVKHGIITGKENGTHLDPQGNTARCEAAAIIQRFFDSIK